VVAGTTKDFAATGARNSESDESWIDTRTAAGVVAIWSRATAKNSTSRGRGVKSLENEKQNE
jgi:hypothetical protein